MYLARRTVFTGLLALFGGSRALAEPPSIEAVAVAPSAPAHDVYVDLLGKGGLWGLGYDYRATMRLAVGAVGSLYELGGDRFVTFSPYVGIYPIAGARHAWFVHLGPQVVFRTTTSPGPEWPGMTTSGVDVETSTGYEYRNHILLRVYVMASAGAEVVPWLGASVGWAL